MLPGSSGGGQLGQEEKVERAGSWLPVCLHQGNCTWIWILYEPFFDKTLKTTDLF